MSDLSENLGDNLNIVDAAASTITIQLTDSLVISENQETISSFKKGRIAYEDTPLFGGHPAYGGNPLEDSISFSETLKRAFNFNLETSLEINDSLKLKPYICGSVSQSKYGTFVYGSRVYGMNVQACDCLGISESLLRKFNDCWIFDIEDSIAFSEEFTIESTYNLALDDSLEIVESLIDTHGIKGTISDSLTIAESVANSTTLNISDSISFIAPSLLEFTLEEGIILSTAWKFYIRTPAGDRIASLTNARGRWFREALNHGGAAGFILDSADDNCNSTILATNQNELIIEYQGYDMWGGQISTITKKAEGNNIYWEVIAKQFFNLLEKRFCGYNKSTGISDVREFVTTDAGTIAWTLIDESQNESNGDFGITEGTIQSSLNRTKSYERKNIAQALLELSESDFGFDFEITTDKVFNVYYPFKGETRNEVVFRYPGNCFNLQSIENGWDVINHELGLGRHWGGAEIQYVADDVTSQGSYTRREAIESYKDMEILAFLTSMVDEDIAYNKDINKVVKFSSFIDAKTKPYLYELGDSVRVVADDFDVNENLYVYERRFAIDENDVVIIDLTLGD